VLLARLIARADCAALAAAPAAARNFAIDLRIPKCGTQQLRNPKPREGVGEPVEVCCVAGDVGVIFKEVYYGIRNDERRCEQTEQHGTPTT